MSRPLTLHPQEGVNPTLGVCFWCGKEDGTIGLLGLNKGKKARKRSVLTLEPCAACKEVMTQGIVVIEATNYQRDPWQVEVQPGAYPTGRWAVVKREANLWEAVKEPHRTLIMQQGRCFLAPEMYEWFGFVTDHVAS
jgi:hypothetical protein